MGTHPIFESDFDCLTEKMPATSESAKLKDDLSVLTKKKEVMEQLIAAYREQGMIGEELIDREGFPRNDVDLVAVRTARNKHVCLQNDHKALMHEIEIKLNDYHKIKKQSIQKPKFSNVHQEPSIHSKAFAYIEDVKSVSPAYLAGLCVNDEIVQMDDISAENFTSLQLIANKLSEKENLEVDVFIRRYGTLHKLTLVPKKWDGPGLLGAKMSSKKI